MTGRIPGPFRFTGKRDSVASEEAEGETFESVLEAKHTAGVREGEISKRAEAAVAKMMEKITTPAQLMEFLKAAPQAASDKGEGDGRWFSEFPIETGAAVAACAEKVFQGEIAGTGAAEAFKRLNRRITDLVELQMGRMFCFQHPANTEYMRTFGNIVPAFNEKVKATALASIKRGDGSQAHDTLEAIVGCLINYGPGKNSAEEARQQIGAALSSLRG